MNAIQITGLSRDYGKRRVVDRLSLTVAQGELFALLGVNGAGKSTTIKMLCCLAAPTEGDAALMGRSVRTDSPGAREVLAGLGLGQWAKQRARTLSGGWQRRLSIAMALVSRPEVLFLDEPTLGLDVLARRELWGVIRGLKGRTAIVLTTHYLEEAEAWADRIGVMAAGRLRAVGTPEELKALAGCETFEDAFVSLAGEGAAS